MVSSWHELKSVSEKVQALRCGLDEEQWIGIERPYQCMQLLGVKERPSARRPLPFDLEVSYDLYLKFFGQAKELISDKRLLIVNSGPLSSLPLAVFVSTPPSSPRPSSYAGYDDVSWLGASSPIVVLTFGIELSFAGNLTRTSSGERQYTGFGNPTLSGDCSRPNIRQTCAAAKVGNTPREAVRGISEERGLHPGSIIGNEASEASLAAAIRSLCRLPDTAFEIQCVAKMLGASGEDLHLGRDATKATLQSLNESGMLAHYRIIQFSTHGLLPSESIRIGAAQAEPALVLTPPTSPRTAADNGLLTASEIARLGLNAD